MFPKNPYGNNFCLLPPVTTWSLSGIGVSATDGTETNEDANERTKDGPTAVIKETVIEGTDGASDGASEPSGFPSGHESGMSTKRTYKEILTNEKENRIGKISVRGEKSKFLTSQTLAE